MNYIMLKDRYEEVVASMLLSENIQLNILNYLEDLIINFEDQDPTDYLKCIKAFRDELNRKRVLHDP